MNQENLRELLEAAAVEFNPFTFIRSIFVTLQNARSDAVIAPNQLFKHPTDITIASKSESYVNAFLRLLGFPATRDETNLATDDFTLSERQFRLSQGDTLNYFSQGNLTTTIEVPVESTTSNSVTTINLAGLSSPSTVTTLDLSGVSSTTPQTTSPISQTRTITTLTDSTGRNVAERVLRREQALSQEKTVEDHLRMITDPLSFLVSLEDNNSRRPSIFPLVVSADVPVFPLKKRVAPAFFDGDFIRSNVRLTRPFIEHVVYMRTKNFAGSNNPVKDALIANITSEISGLPEVPSNDTGDTLDSNNPQQSLINSVNDFSLLQLQLTDKFVKALKSCAVRYRATLRKAEELKKKALYIPDNKREFSEKAGEANLSNAQREELVTTVEGASTIGSRTIENKIQRLKEQRATIESFTQLLPIESINQSDKIRRLSDPFTINNIIPDAFVSEFSSLTSFELGSINQRIKEAEQERALTIQNYENVRSNIMLFTGEISGLSIFDIICVLFALFTVDIQYLVALLNTSSQQRLLESDVFYSSNTSDSTNSLFIDVRQLVDEAQDISAGEAVMEVEKQVKLHFDLANSFFRAASKSGENKTRDS